MYNLFYYLVFLNFIFNIIRSHKLNHTKYYTNNNNIHYYDDSNNDMNYYDDSNDNSNNFNIIIKTLFTKI